MEHVKKIASSFKHDQYVLYSDEILSEEAVNCCKKNSSKNGNSDGFYSLFHSFLQPNPSFLPNFSFIANMAVAGLCFFIK